jgi:hypothetical protein
VIGKWYIFYREETFHLPNIPREICFEMKICLEMKQTAALKSHVIRITKNRVEKNTID